MKKALCIILALSVFQAMPQRAGAVGWQEEGTRYEMSDGSYAKGLVTIDGIKYLFDNEGVLTGAYTGWTKNNTTGARNYYRDGKRQAGWRIIGGKRYYFYYEGSAAVGDVQIEDKIYSFDEKGVFTGVTAEPIVYAKNISGSFYADELPEYISVPYFYNTNDTRYFQVHNAVHDGDIEKYANGKWELVEPNPDPPNSGICLEGYGYIISDSDDPAGEEAEDCLKIQTERYTGKLTAGKYRAALTVSYYPDGQSGDDESYEGTIYSYFTIE
ncbi:MAG: hypothetical protein K2K57_08920 [Oscillospiraceae bacterium]|nr:hypothetical protein [Oscillospiraceae bacterium]